MFYVAKCEDAMCVIHAFEKRTTQTREADIALACIAPGFLDRTSV
ncbi:MAG: hypothetical protein M3Q38_04725 [Chloroflexota bacterium]|nr:hypothetical protein [Chloroflexota bacterium]